MNFPSVNIIRDKLRVGTGSVVASSILNAIRFVVAFLLEFRCMPNECDNARALIPQDLMMAVHKPINVLIQVRYKTVQYCVHDYQTQTK